MAVTEKTSDPNGGAAPPSEQLVATELSRTMSLLNVVMIGVGAMIGAGIFVLTGIAAGHAGPALILVFLFNGVVTTLTALSYAELGSCFPEAGGGYIWVKKALPQPNGFLAGWMDWFAHAVACSLYAVAFGAFATKILSFIPALHFLEDDALSVKVMSVLIVLAFTYINCRGAEETGKVETVVTIMKIIIIAIFCLAGFWAIFFRTENPQGSFSDWQTFVPNGLGGIAVAMGLTFIAFEGYEIIAQCGEEIQDPKKNIPRSIFLSVLIVVPIYMVVAFVVIAGVTIPEDYSGPATTNWAYLGELKELAMIHAAEKFMPFGGLVFLLGGIFSTMSALNATIYSSSRVSFSMGRDHHFPAVFARIHLRRKTPHMAIILSAVLIVGMAVALPIEEVASATDVMFLLLFVLVNIALINLRRNQPGLDRGFKVPFVPFLPLLAIVLNLALAGFLFWHYTLGVGVTAAYLALGVLVYLAYSRSKEAEAKQTPTVYVETSATVDSDYRVLTPIANPRSVAGLMSLSHILAADKRSEILVANILKIPAQLPPSAARTLLTRPKELLAKAQRFKLRGKPLGDAAKTGSRPGEHPGEPLAVTSIIKISHSVPVAIRDAVRERRVDLLVLGWRGGARRRNAFLGDALDDIVFNAECDVVIMVRPTATFLDKASRIIVPVLVDYRQAYLSLEIAHALSTFSGLPVEALHVTPRHEVEHEDVVRSLSKGAESLLDKIDLTSLTSRIVHAKNVYGTILSEVRKTDVVVIEGLHEGVFSRNFFGEVPERLACEIRNPVVLTKKYPGGVINWFQKFFGTRMPEPHS